MNWHSFMAGWVAYWLLCEVSELIRPWLLRAIRHDALVARCRCGAAQETAELDERNTG